MKQIERVDKIDLETFIACYIGAGNPVIVTDGMNSWSAKDKWTPEYFRDRFGDLNTQIYDNLFTLMNILPLRDYIDQFFGKDEGAVDGPYARWYVKFKDIDFYWSDEVFEAIAQDWGHPYFLPTTSYVMPFCPMPRTISAHGSAFPYKGLFISARGARTKLHRDPFGTDAVLCQFYGVKRLTFYSPEDDNKLRQGKKFVDPQNPDVETFSLFSQATPAYQDDLRPGEILFIPSGWFHDVVSVTDSISVTWNFVHAAHRDPFLREISDPSNDFDRDMLDFFFASGGTQKVQVPEITRLALSV
jgi:hypothetical protein